MATPKANESDKGHWNSAYDKYFEVHEERKAKGEKLIEYVDQ
jgi:hypothetical protein